MSWSSRYGRNVFPFGEIDVHETLNEEPGLTIDELNEEK